jgi:hypothetical protein
LVALDFESRSAEEYSRTDKPAGACSEPGRRIGSLVTGRR